jgi:acylphosphatase
MNYTSMHLEGIKRMVDRQLEHGKKEEELKKQEIAELFKERARVHIFAHGKVQGVFFRDHAKKTADSLGLTGWAKNTKNAVEIVAEGDKMKLRELIVACQKGSPLSKVDKVEYQWEDYTGKFDSFYINY